MDLDIERITVVGGEDHFKLKKWKKVKDRNDKDVEIEAGEELFTLTDLENQKNAIEVRLANVQEKIDAINDFKNK